MNDEPSVSVGDGEKTSEENGSKEETEELEQHETYNKKLDEEVVHQKKAVPIFGPSTEILHPDYQLARVEQNGGWGLSTGQLMKKALWLFYIKNWIFDYNTTLFKADVTAGLTVVGMAIPQAIAYTGVIGVYPSVGLYTACIGLCLYPLFGTSRHMTFGCSSMSTIITLAVMANFPITSMTPEYNTAVKTLAFMTGVFFFAMAIFGIGFIASFLSYPVLLGFTAGSALQIASSQIKYAFALRSHATSWIDNVKLLGNWGDINWTAFGFCLCTFFVLMASKGIPKYFPNFKHNKLVKSLPWTFMLTIFFTLLNFAGRFLHHTQDGEWNRNNHRAPEIVGPVNLAFPKRIDLDFNLVNQYPNTFLLQSLSSAIVIFTTHIAVAANYALKYEYDLFPSHEMYAHGIINLIGSLFGIFPSGGVITHAPLADQAGAKTLMFNWVCAVVMIIVMIIMGSLPNLVYWLPRSVLAGIVWSACVGMFPYEKMKETVQIDTKDSYVLVLTMLCTTLWGIFEGIEVGFVLSILFLVQRSSKPHCAILGRIPNTVEYSNITSWPNAITTPGIVIFRFDGALHFGTVHYFRRAIQVLVQRCHNIEGKPLCYFILDCSAINDIDSSGLIAIENVWKYLQQNQIILLFAELKYPVIKLLKRSRFLQDIGLHHFFHNVFQAHMHIYMRFCFYRKLQLPTFSKTDPNHFDYVDPKGTNLIHLDNVDLSILDKPFTDDEQALVEKQDPFGISTHTHPLSIERKGFELRSRSLRVSLAPKSELIPLRPVHSPL